MAEPVVHVLLFKAAPRRLQQHGMLGWLRLQVDGLLIDGVSLRESPSGAFGLSFPERRDASRQRHAVVRPLDDETRTAIESQVFAALGVKGDSA